MSLTVYPQATGAWILAYSSAGVEIFWPFTFPSENAALLFAAMNTKLLK